MAKNQIQELAQAIYDKKGFNILAIDVKGISTLTDRFLIAEGNVDRHVQALADTVEEVMKERYQTRPLYVEGRDHGDWIVLDYGDIVIHVFTPEMRDRYRIEEIWNDGLIIDLDISISEKGGDSL